VTGFIGSFVLLIAMVAVCVAVARRRPAGARLTWGEAFVAGLWVFSVMFVAYGMVPHHWLTWASNELRWRSDTIGVPLGPLGGLLKGHLGIKDGRLFPDGVPLPNGRFIVPASAIMDSIAAGLYIVFLAGQLYAWLWWQKRHKKAAARPELVSAYGRPLVRKV
jgi:hypothetical protein